MAWLDAQNPLERPRHVHRAVKPGLLGNVGNGQIRLQQEFAGAINSAAAKLLGQAVVKAAAEMLLQGAAGNVHGPGHVRDRDRLAKVIADEGHRLGQIGVIKPDNVRAPANNHARGRKDQRSGRGLAAGHERVEQFGGAVDDFRPIGFYARQGDGQNSAAISTFPVPSTATSSGTRIPWSWQISIALTATRSSRA